MRRYASLEREFPAQVRQRELQIKAALRQEQESIREKEISWIEREFSREKIVANAIAGNIDALEDVRRRALYDIGEHQERLAVRRKQIEEAQELERIKEHAAMQRELAASMGRELPSLVA